MKIDIAKARARTGSRYPTPFDEPCRSARAEDKKPFEQS
jgi:hypothetical protein